MFVLLIHILLNTSCTKTAGEGKCVFRLVVSPDFSCCTRTPNVPLASTLDLSRNCVPFMDFQRPIHHYLPNNPASHVTKSILPVFLTRWFQWLPGLGRGSVALRLLGLRVRVPPRHGCLYGIKTNWCHYFNFIYILPGLYMFRAHRPILRRVHTAVHTTIGSVSILLWPCALCIEHNIQSTRPEQ